MLPPILDFHAIRAAYASGLTPLDVIEEVIARRNACTDPAIFISVPPDDALRAAARVLMERAPAPNSLPLWGIPCAIKDNIDVLGLPTTAACPAFAYQPEEDAVTTARLQAAGALIIGKTNLDQFATGLNGTRSPYGAPRCVFDEAYISGGSSSGSAVAVAAGLCSFALGTDTAGSGRVPAAFNNIVGIKPTPGLVPSTGVVPACRSVDTVSVLAATVADGIAVRRVIEGYDARDPFSRPAAPASLPAAGLRIAVLDGQEREFFGNEEVERLYDNAIRQAEQLGATIIPFDYAPFRAAAELLYNGPWVAERLAAVQDFIGTHADDFDPVVRAIIEGAKTYDAVQAFQGRYRLEALRQITLPVWNDADILMLPTVPTTYTVDDIRADPLVKNSHLGRYTNFANLFGYAAISVPAGFDRRNHLPAGVTLFGPAFTDDALAFFADAMHRTASPGMGKDKTAVIPEASRVPAPSHARITLAVVGAHLSGLPLNHQLTGSGGKLLSSRRTAAHYRLFLLPETTPPKPGLINDPGFSGPGIEVELWDIPAAAFGHFVAAIPAPLGIGRITLDDGSQVSGFLCEHHAVTEAQEITAFGGWRDFLRNSASR